MLLQTKVILLQTKLMLREIKTMWLQIKEKPMHMHGDNAHR